jgi:hypothetical protein
MRFIYENSVSPDLLTPSELAKNSHLKDVQSHYGHLLQECKDGVVRVCYLCNEVRVPCDECKRTETATIPQLEKKGWRFDVGEDGITLCHICSPWLPNGEVKPEGGRFSKLTAMLKDIWAEKREVKF